jgi:hypothetical protein
MEQNMAAHNLAKGCSLDMPYVLKKNCLKNLTEKRLPKSKIMLYLQRSIQKD